jgi:hypothetical protein
LHKGDLWCTFNLFEKEEIFHKNLDFISKNKKCNCFQIKDVQDLYLKVRNIPLDHNQIENLRVNFNHQLSDKKQFLAERYNYSTENTRIYHFIPLTREGSSQLSNLIPLSQLKITQIFYFLQNQYYNQKHKSLFIDKSSPKEINISYRNKAAYKDNLWLTFNLLDNQEQFQNFLFFIQKMKHYSSEQTHQILTLCQYICSLPIDLSQLSLFQSNLRKSFRKLKIFSFEINYSQKRFFKRL